MHRDNITFRPCTGVADTTPAEVIPDDRAVIVDTQQYSTEEQFPDDAFPDYPAASGPSGMSTNIGLHGTVHYSTGELPNAPDMAPPPEPVIPRKSQDVRHEMILLEAQYRQLLDEYHSLRKAEGL